MKGEGGITGERRKRSVVRVAEEDEGGQWRKIVRVRV